MIVTGTNPTHGKPPKLEVCMLKQTILIIFLLSISFAQKMITGQVFDENRKPLSYAVITDVNNRNWVISDENGFFSKFSKSELGDSIIVSRYGYNDVIIIIDEQTHYDVVLSTEMIEGEPITVVGNSQSFPKQIAQTYISSKNTTTKSAILNKIPGISIRNYGGRAGNAAISTNGSKVENTKIILGNIDLTSVQNGQTDISQIPAAMIQQITVANSPSILYGSGAVDAAFKIDPTQKRSSVGVKYGSYNFKAIDANFSQVFNKLSVYASAGYLTDDGNYDYTLEDVEYKRENNDFLQQYYYIRSKYNINQKSNIDLFILNTKQERGSAGSIAWLSPFARHNDELLAGSILYNILHSKGFTKVQLNYRKSIDKYVDTNPSWPTKSKHTINDNLFKIDHHQYLYNNISANFQYDLKNERINSTDVDDHTRITNSLAGELYTPFLEDFEIVPGLRYDTIDDVEAHLTKSAKIAYYGLPNSNMEYSIATGFRSPSFNDMYWNPGGNPDLKSETSWYHTFKLSSYLGNNTINKIYLYLADRHSDQLIQWVPIDETYFTWEPQNIAKSRRSNLTIGMQYQFNNIPISIAGHYTYQVTEDIDLNKPLLYAPNNIAFISIQYIRYNFNVGLQTHYTGERIAAYGDPTVTIDGFALTDATIQYNLNLLNHILSASIEINNIFDKEYIVMSGYPEPGRTINCGITFTL